MKIKNKNLRKYKIKKFIFFKSKLGQEIKIRKKSGKNQEKSGKIQKKSKNPSKYPHKNLSLFDRFSLAHSCGSSVPLGTIINKSHSQALCSKCFSARPRG